MDRFIVGQFVDFFKDYFNLCQQYNWPNDKTTPEEIRSAFSISQHIEKCLDRFQKQSLMEDFINLLSNEDITCHVFLKKYLSDPPKYILKKILNSSADITKVDVAFDIFLDLFSEQKLEVCLSDLMVEAASKETLLKNINIDIPKDKMLDFKSKYLLTKLNDKKYGKEVIFMLNSCTKDDMEVLIESLLCKDMNYNDAVNIILNAFVNYMSGRDVLKKNFWKLFFSLNEEKFLEVCLSHGNIFLIICNTLITCGKAIRENMIMNNFYIELTNSELSMIVQTICKNEILKSQFLKLANERDGSLNSWYDLML